MEKIYENIQASCNPDVIFMIGILKKDELYLLKILNRIDFP